MNLNDYKLINENEAVKRFNLKALFDSYGCRNASEYGSGSVRVYEGDLHIDGPLLLDFDRGAWVGSRHEGMIVTGNLVVSGNILNTNYNYGPFLLVLGNVSADNLVGGGAEIHIVGNADLKETIIGYYNDGSLIIDQTSKARLVINDDHDLRLHKYAGPYYDRRKAFYSGEALLKLSDYFVPQVSVETDEDDEIKYEIVDIGKQVIPRLEKGLPLLKAAAAKKQSKK